MLFILITAIGFYTSTAELVSSIPCEYITDEQLLCRQTSFTDDNIPLNKESNYSQIIQFEWIESGAYIFSDNLFELFSDLKNVSLRSNALTSLSILPFWSHLKSISHLDLSQNRLITINNRDFQSFKNLISLNISLNFLTTIEPIWLLIPLHIIDLSQNGINSIGYIKLQNSTSEINSCVLEQIYFNNNRGLLSFTQLQMNIMNTCPFIDRFQLMNNHWHCACNDLIHSLKHYRKLILIDEFSKSLSGQCETPLAFRNIDIQKMHEELVCDNNLLLFDSTLNDEQSSSSSFLSRQIIFLFILGCIIGIIIGLCLHYCAYRCLDVLSYLLYKCNRQKIINERNVNESIQMNDSNHNANRFIYCPTNESDTLPSYSQVMNDIFYLDVLNRQHQTEFDGEC
ncbi:unnamed protein product [Adineta steineri]|uniref:Uncharacterized protein n=1 Tax=Adineta steineri TaxID=433720 RepID=A0A815HG60_9BILA|nr:unnamed protein product [Adineta steineri]CAF1514788.1 unnamed protein product [Adineta steineri]